jgi:hypothetical protein
VLLQRLPELINQLTELLAREGLDVLADCEIVQVTGQRFELGFKCSYRQKSVTSLFGYLAYID